MFLSACFALYLSVGLFLSLAPRPSTFISVFFFLSSPCASCARRGRLSGRPWCPRAAPTAPGRAPSPAHPPHPALGVFCALRASGRPAKTHTLLRAARAAGGRVACGRRWGGVGRQRGRQRLRRRRGDGGQGLLARDGGGGGLHRACPPGHGVRGLQRRQRVRRRRKPPLAPAPFPPPTTPYTTPYTTPCTTHTRMACWHPVQLNGVCVLCAHTPPPTATDRERRSAPCTRRYALDSKNCSQKWAFPTGDQVYSSPATVRETRTEAPRPCLNTHTHTHTHTHQPPKPPATTSPCLGHQPPPARPLAAGARGVGLASCTPPRQRSGRQLRATTVTARYACAWWRATPRTDAFGNGRLGR